MRPLLVTPNHPPFVTPFLPAWHNCMTPPPSPNQPLLDFSEPSNPQRILHYQVVDRFRLRIGMRTNAQLPEVAMPLTSTHALKSRPQDNLCLSRLGSLLLLALVLGEGLFEQLENLFVLDLLVSLELGQIPS